jgi:hypothetical protein
MSAQNASVDTSKSWKWRLVDHDEDPTPTKPQETPNNARSPLNIHTPKNKSYCLLKIPSKSLQFPSKRSTKRLQTKRAQLRMLTKQEMKKPKKSYRLSSPRLNSRVLQNGSQFHQNHQPAHAPLPKFSLPHATNSEI